MKRDCFLWLLCKYLPTRMQKTSWIKVRTMVSSPILSDKRPFSKTDGQTLNRQSTYRPPSCVITRGSAPILSSVKVRVRGRVGTINLIYYNEGNGNLVPRVCPFASLIGILWVTPVLVMSRWLKMTEQFLFRWTLFAPDDEHLQIENIFRIIFKWRHKD